MFTRNPYLRRRLYRRRWKHLHYLSRLGCGIACAAMLAACDTDETVSPPPTAVFEIEVAEQETFRIALQDADLIEAAEQIMAAGRVGVIHGTLARSDGGFNAPYSWHIAPETVTFPDVAMEVCSGRPLSDVEADLDYWIDHLGVYCPWDARILRRLP